MVEACDGLIPYRTNPHVDQRERGLEAADLLARTLRGAIRPTQAASMPPMAMDIECQRTSEPPCLSIYDLARELQRDPRVLSTSILLGFPYADVPEMGTAALCITDNDQDLASEISHQLGKRLWHDRHTMVGRHVTIDEALRQAANLPGPVLLLDMGDNVGGGSPGDSTHLAGAIVQRRIEKSFVCLFDPGSALQAQQAGVGSRLALRLGGKTDNRHGQPLDAECHVIGIYDGRFHEPETRHGGIQHFDQGLTAIVRTDDDVTFMLTSRRMAPFSLRQLTSCQVDPASFHLIVAKGVNAPLAAYQSVCRHFIRVNTPGVTVADMTQLRYQRRRRPMFPFEADTQWTAPGAAVV
jgi:microcystin degradation protein MlrC